MTMEVVTVEYGKMILPVMNNLDAARVLKKLYRDGITCIRWEVKECSQNG